VASLLGTRKGYVEKFLETNISFFFGGGNLEEGSSTRDFKRPEKGLCDGASLWEEAAWRGPWGGSFTGGP
jgi:hypothetical protein